MPDNRTELNEEKKITKILVSAYPTTSYTLITELSSDNVDDYGPRNPNTVRLYNELFRWNDVSEIGLDTPNDLWESCYKAIGSANQALNAIVELGNPESLKAEKGEALLARAYSHFILVNVFSMHYTTKDSNKDLGIPYLTSPETELSPQYSRGTVKEVYDHITKDIEEGLPLINDAIYNSTPKFHMNKAASYAFAARVALYMQQWAKAVDYANKAIGVNPIMRNTTALANSGAQSPVQMGVFYNASTERANLLIQTGFSNAGLVFGPYYEGSKYSHGSLIYNTETWGAPGAWGKLNSTAFRPRLYEYGGTNLDKVVAPHQPYLFEFTDPVAQIGYRHNIYAPFTVEETMLVRAEANIMLKKYPEAVEELKRVINNKLVNPVSAAFGLAQINTWAKETPYFTASLPTPKKQLAPEFLVEAGDQENLLHFLLHVRRNETLHLGLRWFDIKRYGIEVERRVLEAGTVVASIESATKLVNRDKRQALQLPKAVIAAGLQANPR